jgi:hypothetical protein
MQGKDEGHSHNAYFSAFKPESLVILIMLISVLLNLKVWGGVPIETSPKTHLCFLSLFFIELMLTINNTHRFKW